MEPNEPVAQTLEPNTTVIEPEPVTRPQYPIYTVEELAGRLSRGESCDIDRLAATLVATMQSVEQVVEWANRKIQEEAAEAAVEVETGTVGKGSRKR